MTNKKYKYFFLDVILFLLFLTLSINGLLLQKVYHMDHNDISYIFLWFNKDEWLFIHKIVSILLTIGITIHITWHWNWLKDLFKNNRLFQKSYKNKALIFLFIVFCISAILAFASWLVNNSLFGYNTQISHMLIEIHDKLTLLLIILFIIHFIKKIRWFINTGKEIVTKNHD